MQQQQRIPGVFSTQPVSGRDPIFLTITTPTFRLDYHNRNYIYVFSQGPFQLGITGFAVIDYQANAWINLPYPETTQIAQNADELHVQCVDVPLVLTSIQVPRIIDNFVQINQRDVGNSFSTGQLSGSAWSDLAIDFTVYSITGGVSPTVTFLVSRVGLDGQLYQLEKATALSGAGKISYSIGAGLDGKSFGGLFQVDMVTTGNPTNVNISGSIYRKS
jgi:hypothetical protein